MLSVILPLTWATEAALAGHLFTFWKVSVGSRFFLFGCQYCHCDATTAGKNAWPAMREQPEPDLELMKALYSLICSICATNWLIPDKNLDLLDLCKKTNVQNPLTGNFYGNAMHCNTAVQEALCGYCYKESA